MQVTIHEIRQLRKTLDQNRMEHEALVTQARILREHCQEMRNLCAQASNEVLSIFQSPEDALAP